MSASLCCTLLFIGLFKFVSADQEPITAEPGQDVTLSCRAPNNNNTIRVVKWSRADLGKVYVLLYRDGHSDPDNQHPSFKNRVDLQDRQMKDGDVSVILRNVTTDDTGTYECRVVQKETNYRNDEPISIIQLSVVPPGPPGGAVGVKVGLSVSAVLLVAAVVGFLIYRKKQSQDPNQPPDDPKQV